MYTCDIQYYATLIAAIGGILIVLNAIFKAIHAYKDRIRIQVRLLEERNPEKTYHPVCQKIKFEIINMSSKATALKPEIKMTGYTPKRNKVTNIFIIYDEHRGLSDSMPKSFFAQAKEYLDDYSFLWFKTYKFNLIKGKSKKLYIKTANMEHLSALRHYWELLLFKFIGRI